MPRHLTLIAVLLLSARLVAAAEDSNGDARALVQRVVDTAPQVPYVTRMSLTTPGGLERDFTVSGKKLPNGIDARYLEVTAPANLKDSRYLFYDRTETRDDQYMWLPFMRRIVRLSEKTRREPFLGSTFFVNDMIKRTIDDYTYRFVGSETIGQRTCTLVESVPKHPEEEMYGRSVFAIDPTDLIVLRAQLFDQDGHLFKVHTVNQIEKIDGYWTPRLQTMENIPDKGVSQLTTVEVQYNAAIGDDIFREAYLGR